MSAVSSLSSYIHSKVDFFTQGLGLGVKSGVISGIASQALSDKMLLLWNAFDSSVSFPPGYDMFDLTKKEMLINAALLGFLGDEDFSKGIKAGITYVTFNQVVFIVAARMIEYRIRDLGLPRSKQANFNIQMISFFSVSAVCYGGGYLGGLLGIVFAANICMLVASLKAPRGGIFVSSPFRV